jgi:hypothetical protein
LSEAIVSDERVGPDRPDERLLLDHVPLGFDEDSQGFEGARGKDEQFLFPP